MDTEKFEKARAELKAELAKMENKDLSLDDMLESYEKGIVLAKTCQSELEKVEERVRVISKKHGILEESELK